MSEASTLTNVTARRRIKFNKSIGESGKSTGESGQKPLGPQGSPTLVRLVGRRPAHLVAAADSAPPHGLLDADQHVAGFAGQVRCVGVRRDPAGPSDVRFLPGRRYGTPNACWAKILRSELRAAPVRATIGAEFRRPAAHVEVSNRTAARPGAKENGQVSSPRCKSRPEPLSGSDVVDLSTPASRLSGSDWLVGSAGCSRLVPFLPGVLRYEQ